MFVDHEITLNLSFRVAQARLLIFTAGHGLSAASAEAFAEGHAEMARIAPFRSVPGSSTLARVRFVQPQPHDRITSVPVRWEVAGSTGSLFPVLDADLKLFPAGECTLLVLSAAFRMPVNWFYDALDNLGLRQVATTMVSALLHKVALQLCPETGPPGRLLPSTSPGNNGDRRRGNQL